MEERVPYFLDTELYLEYVLCKLLLETRVTLTRSSHKIDYGQSDMNGVVILAVNPRISG